MVVPSLNIVLNILKENHIGSAVREHRDTDKQTDRDPVTLLQGFKKYITKFYQIEIKISFMVWVFSIHATFLYD